MSIPLIEGPNTLTAHVYQARGTTATCWCGQTRMTGLHIAEQPEERQQLLALLETALTDAEERLVWARHYLRRLAVSEQ